ncbi:MAG: tyrosine--tRNA ligase [Lentisphaeria bacterium]|nr:tyrosine--tRNA ligase [Lentisphaeria bacterium]
MSTLFDRLKERGFIEAVTDEKLPDYLEEKPFTVYVGFDPTADSLHLGHLLPIMAMHWFQQAGHRVLLLVGGATGMVGDPSGRSDERNLLTKEEIDENVRKVKLQIGKFIDFDSDNPAEIVNNIDWIGPMTFIDWLRDVGKHFNINHMLAKDSVKSRLASETGISYTEFSYQTMQAYDFKYLCEHEDCLLQCGGSDQWGNITAGIDLVRKSLQKQAYGITFPLLATSSGEKFGKSAGNAVWLDPELTSPYKFYQYWINSSDDDVERFLNYFTFMDMSDIAAVVDEHAAEPHRRLGQNRLAAEMTRLVHGEEGLKIAELASNILFGGDIEGLSDAELSDIFADVPSSEMAMADLEQGMSVIDVFSACGLAKSKGDARRLIQGGGARVNNQKIAGIEAEITKDMLASESCIVLRSGKKNYHLIKFK